MKHSLMDHHIRRTRCRFTDEPSRTDADSVWFPEQSLLRTCPETIQRDLYDNAIVGGPTLQETYGKSPSDYIVSAIRYGPAGVTTASITTVTNKAVISALLLTFNYSAVSSAAQQPDTSDLYRTYFFCQMTAVVLAFSVMLSAATFISHVSRCGQHCHTLIRYLQSANWIDQHLNEPLFVAQCFFTIMALVLDVAITYSDSFMLYSFIGMVVICIGLLVVAHVRSRIVLHRLSKDEWIELVQAEEELRVWMCTWRRNGGPVAVAAAERSGSSSLDGGGSPQLHLTRGGSDTAAAAVGNSAVIVSSACNGGIAACTDLDAVPPRQVHVCGNLLLGRDPYGASSPSRPAAATTASLLQRLGHRSGRVRMAASTDVVLAEEGGGGSGGLQRGDAAGAGIDEPRLGTQAVCLRNDRQTEG
ncbi:hypothetical protein Vretimale_7772 [Volvox reticuliferus]|uniref:Uncharacterized protein n=2 Tax=Volvox reticuliferus TaxID=1737510 RepID=A0A8J4G9X4_9CHLO|nr:hypothetical protein Vretimale_7772 [Volvox reticuliferus]